MDSLRTLTLNWCTDESLSGPSSKHLVRLFRDGAKFSGKHELRLSNRPSLTLSTVPIEVTPYTLARLFAILGATSLMPATGALLPPTNSLRQLVLEMANDEIVFSRVRNSERWLIRIAGAWYQSLSDLPSHGYDYLERECLLHDPSAFLDDGGVSKSAIAHHSTYEIRTPFCTIAVRVGQHNPVLLALESHHGSDSSALLALGSMKTVESARMRNGYQFADNIQTQYSAAWYEARVLPLGLENTIERRFAIFVTGKNLDAAQLQKLLRSDWALFGSRGTLNLL